MTFRKAIILALLAACLQLVAADAWAESPPCGKEPAMGRGLHKTLFSVHKKYDKKKYAEALGILDEYAKDHDAVHHRLSFMRGILNYQLGHKKAACRDFKAALKAWPCFAPALRNLANVQYDLGRYKAAAVTAGNAYRMIKPRDFDLAYMAAVFHLSAGQPQKALPYLDTLLKQKKPQKKWLLAMVRARMDLKQWDKAQKVLAGVLQRYPQDAGLWRLSASLQMRLKRYDKAAAALEVALHVETPRKGDWRALAELHRAVGAHAKSARYFVMAFGPKPTAKQWLTLSRTYVLAQDMDNALFAAQKAAEMDPCCANQAFLAEILLRKRQYRQADRAYLNAAQKAFKHNHRKCCSLAMQSGYCAMRTGELDRAMRAFRLAQKAAPQKSREAKNAAKWCEEVKLRQQAEADALPHS